MNLKKQRIWKIFQRKNSDYFYYRIRIPEDVISISNFKLGQAINLCIYAGNQLGHNDIDKLFFIDKRSYEKFKNKFMVIGEFIMGKYANHKHTLSLPQGWVEQFAKSLNIIFVYSNIYGLFFIKEFLGENRKDL